MQRLLFLPTFFTILLASCGQDYQPLRAVDVQNFNEVCLSAISAPAAPLISVVEGGPGLTFNTSKQVLVSTFMATSIYNQFWKTPPTTITRESYVTVVPEVATFCKNYVASHSLKGNPDCSSLTTARLNKYLGLRPEDTTDKTFVTYYVDPTSLVRPCYNTDPRTGACFRLPNASSNKSYNQIWLEAKYGNSSGGNLDPNGCYPFTGMGYTYDWGNSPVNGFIGANEFIVPKGTNITEVAQVTVAQACGC
jgi:hypothetical protein